jgi:hypothetical protein
MRRLDLWLAKLKVARAEEKLRVKEYNQAKRAMDNVWEKINQIEERISDEKTKLARAE